MNIDWMIRNLSQEETKEAAETALDYLTNEVALEVVIKWIEKNEGMKDEILSKFATEEE